MWAPPGIFISSTKYARVALVASRAVAPSREFEALAMNDSSHSYVETVSPHDSFGHKAQDPHPARVLPFGLKAASALRQILWHSL